MHSKPQFQNSFSCTIPRAATVALAIVFVLALILVFTQPAQAQSYKVIYNLDTFYGSGLFPFSGVTFDKAGNLYVTTKEGGEYGDNGTVFELSPDGSDWVYSPVYSFGGGGDGRYPYDRVIVGPDGNLYGAAASGAGDCQGYGCGTVFRLSYSGSHWTEQTLYAFEGGSDGAVPYSGDLVFDQAGNLYGTTEYGGTGCWGYGCGTVFELTPSGEGWIHNVLYRFTGGNDGAQPYAGVVLDNAGNLYGSSGPIYELTPSGSGWTEKTLYSGRAFPFAGPILDREGNLYVGTVDGGFGNSGTIFELTPSNGNWTYAWIYSFVNPFVHPAFGPTGFGGGPTASLTMDADGNLYGTTSGGGLYGFGAVFKLTHSNSGWAYSSLHDFCSGGRPCKDGANPAGGVTLGPNGNLYGTTEYGGANWGGVVWEITP